MHTRRAWTKNKVAVLISIGNVIALLLLTYILNNQSLFTGENLTCYALVEYFKGKTGLSQERINDDAIIINVGYDKQFVELSDDYGFPLGNSPVTDRTKLLRLLQKLDSTDTYRFIFLDVSFEKGYESSIDNELFAQIKHTPRIVIASHPDVELIDSSLYSVSALNNYDATIVETNFNRYKYSASGRESMPLYAYKMITGDSISKKGFLYFCGGRLCYNSLFVRFPFESKTEYDQEGDKEYYNLGNEILSNYSNEDLGQLCKDKYIFVGDMVEDLHDTYSGIKPGPTITYYAFKELIEGRHIVNISLGIFLAILYFLISMSLLKRKEMWIEKFSWVSKSPIVKFLMSLLGFSFVLSICAIFLGILFDTYISVLVPSLYFTIQKNIIDYKRA